MIAQNISDFWAMDGYGFYVWGSLGVTAAVLALEVLLARMGRRQALDVVCDAIEAEHEDVVSKISLFTPGATA